jgi:hypothetical protein
MGVVNGKHQSKHVEVFIRMPNSTIMFIRLKLQFNKVIYPLLPCVFTVLLMHRREHVLPTRQISACWELIGDIEHCLRFSYSSQDVKEELT